MPRTRTPYPLEFRERIVGLVRAGRTPEELAREFEPSAQTIRDWVQQLEVDQGHRTDALMTDEQLELRRLRRENRQLKIEPEILIRAAAWFARDAGAIPSRDAGS